MVERFHRQLKATIMAQESPNPWTITLPSVLLGICSAVKELLGRSAAEMIYGTTLRLPGEFTQKYTVDAHTNLANYSDKLLAPSSTHTQRSNRTSGKLTTTQSKATKHGTNLATAPQQKAIRVKLPNKFKPYVAPHSQTPAVSRANRSDGGLRMYSCVPLHLRGKTSPTSDTRKQSNVKSNSNIADSDKVIADATAKTTRVGGTIKTPARFVQMVHAIVAPNDIYGGTNRTYRSYNNYNL